LRGTPAFYVTIFVGAAAAGMLALVGFRRFGVVLNRAEQFANDAECPQCKSWGKFDIVSMESVADDDPVESGRPHWLRVRCRKCDNRWRMG
jgi:phage FluMu protein Com